MYPIVEEAILFHQTMREGLTHAIIWNNVKPTKKSGMLCIETLLAKEEYSPQERERKQHFLDYWTQNYDAIREQVFYRKSPIISLAERRGE